MSITITHRDETFTAIPGFPNYYLSLAGKVYSSFRGRVIKTEIDRDGYPIQAMQVGGKQCQRRIHRLMLLTFVGPCPNGLEVLHIDDDKTNNDLSNLKYGTRSENMSTVDNSRRLRHDEIAELMLLDQVFSGRGPGANTVLAKRFGCSVTTVRYHTRPNTEKRRAIRRQILNDLRRAI